MCLAGMTKPFRQMLQQVELPMKDGTTESWQMLNIASLVEYYCATCPLYRQMMERALARHSMPFHVIIYEDEVVAGNIVLQRYAVHMWYAAFLEFGLNTRHEYGWLCFAAMKRTTVPKVLGQFGGVSKALYKALVDTRHPSLVHGHAVETTHGHVLLLTKI
jgi:hypothetical protein